VAARSYTVVSLDELDRFPAMAREVGRRRQIGGAG
jgi:hypothetical protein